MGRRSRQGDVFMCWVGVVCEALLKALADSDSDSSLGGGGMLWLSSVVGEKGARAAANEGS